MSNIQEGLKEVNGHRAVINMDMNRGKAIENPDILLILKDISIQPK